MTTPNEERVATPTDFFCEHTEQGSRLLVMLHRAGHQPAVHTVLAYTDATATEAAARAPSVP